MCFQLVIQPGYQLEASKWNTNTCQKKSKKVKNGGGKEKHGTKNKTNPENEPGVQLCSTYDCSVGLWLVGWCVVVSRET
jgi:hypothetical protein